MALNEALEALTRIYQQMKPVCNLPGLGSLSSGRLGIFAGTVTTDQAQVRVALQPRLDGGTASIREEIHHLVGLQIDDHGSIGHTITKGKIVYSNLGRYW